MSNEYINMVEDVTYCTGCSACANLCPTRAISMSLNENGFYRPSIDTALCTRCSACVKICPIVAGRSESKSKEEIEVLRQI